MRPIIEKQRPRRQRHCDTSFGQLWICSTQGGPQAYTNVLNGTRLEGKDVSDSDESDFGSLLRRLRIERKLSQEDLAERAKMSAAAISALERGSRRAPYRSTVDLLADGLAVEAAARDQLHALAQHWRKSRALPSHGGIVRGAPKATSEPRRNNLPIAISSFIGRARELEDLSGLMERQRLLTIVGPGGIGKTRLVLELATNLLRTYRDGAWFIDLTNVWDPDFVAHAIAGAIGLRELRSEPIDQTLTAFLSDKHVLLVLDSSEHMLAGVARLVKGILSQCSMVSILATSLEPLHVIGEQIYRLGPLSDSARLFVERAREADPTFVPGDAERVEIEALCTRLDGMPLAIELACARLSSMTLNQLATRLRSTLALASKDATETSRHRALRDTIAWSYQLLSTTEQRALMALSVFAGGSTSDAIRAVAIDLIDVDDAVESLVDKSLVQALSSGEVQRHRLLEVVREYACEKLEASGEYEAAARRHAKYFAKHAAAPEIDDLSNLRVALEWHIRNDVPGAVGLVHDLSPYWRVHGAVTEARLWIERVLEIASNKEERAPLLCRAASFATMQDDLAESLAFAYEALDFYQETGNAPGEAEARFRVGEAEHRRGHLDTAQALYEKARAGFAASAASVGEMLCVGNLGMIARQRGDLPLALTLMDEAISRAHELGEKRIESEFTMALAWVQVGAENIAESRRLFERALRERSDAEDPYGVCQARHGLATIALLEGRSDEAFAEFLGTLHAARQLHLKHYVARALHGIAATVAPGYPENAARLLGLADRLFEESGRVLRDSVAYDIAARSIALSLSAQQISNCLEEGRQNEVSTVLALLDNMGPKTLFPGKLPST
jgi:predicted ATPase/DNA-binding XRE family transcriptional regulator